MKGTEGEQEGEKKLAAYSLHEQGVTRKETRSDDSNEL